MYTFQGEDVFGVSYFCTHRGITIGLIHIHSDRPIKQNNECDIILRT